MARKISKAAARAEIKKRAAERQAQLAAEAVARFTPEAFCTTKSGVVFLQQLEFVRAILRGDRRILGACTPRAGKTRPILFALARNAIDTTNTSSLYLAITEKQAKRIAWRPFKRMVREFGLPFELSSDQDMTATCTTSGSVIYFSGCDTIDGAYVWLGESFAGGLVVLDEVANRPDAVLEPVMEVVEDRLNDMNEEHPQAGRLVLISQLPTHPGGYFWRQVTDPTQPWTRFAWSRLDNPFLLRQREELQRTLVEKNLSEDDDKIQREWYARPVWTKGGGRPYRYLAERNGYRPERPAWVDAVAVRSGKIFAAVPWPGITHAIVAIDLGGADRASIQVLGYGIGQPAVQHLFDWTSDRDQHHTWGELMEVCAVIASHFQVVRWVYDSDSSKTEHDTLGRDYGVPLIAAANKTEAVAQIRRLSDHLQRGRVKVILGSATAADFERAQWDQRALQRGKWLLAIGSSKVDASEAFRYAFGEWFDAYKEPEPPMTPEEAAAAAHKAEMDALFSGSQSPDPFVDPGLASLGFDRPPDNGA